MKNVLPSEGKRENKDKGTMNKQQREKDREREADCKSHMAHGNAITYT